MERPLTVGGIQLGTTRAGVRYPDRRDLVIIALAPESETAALFTRNAFCAAPVQVAKAHLQQGRPRCLVINTGNANAGTGAAGVEHAEAICRAAASLVGCEPTAVLPFSTGVIGEPLPVERLLAGLPNAWAARSEAGWQEAAWGILTTDTRPKLASRRLELATGGEVTLTGMTKGAGMICPNMATMLAFIATDAKLSAATLQRLLQESAEGSFNAVTVDGDTSTNDALVLMATGTSGIDLDAPEQQAALAQFAQGLNDLTRQLALDLLRDAEGATKLVTIQVKGGREREECRRTAYTIAHSPLVKTALFASDPNWGRILAAVGRAGIDDLALEGVTIWLDDVCIVARGARHPDYTEAAGQRVMAQPEIAITVELGRGDAAATVWTTDLSHDYVRINAEYRS